MRFAPFAMLLLITPAAVARNIDLSTLPGRDTVQLTIYNAEDLTLVRETRRMTFKKGANPLQFSWANTLIDPTSVSLRFPASADKLELLDTTYPHDKPQMLYWSVQAAEDCEAAVEITYFTSGLSWAADYVCLTDPEENRMDVTGFVRVFNNSGEEYEEAQVRLVVGTINLVEKIAQLAQERYGRVLMELADEDKDALTKEALRQAIVVAPPASALGGAVTFDSVGKPKDIQKESLSEYFIYTIEGTETIPTGWSKRLRSFDGPGAPFRIQYRYRPAEYGDALVRMFLLKNDKDSKLGTTPLPDGVVRVYRRNGHDGLSFLAQQAIKYVPIGDEIELNLGGDPEVIHELVKLQTWRDNFWFHRDGVDVRKPLGGAMQIEFNDRLEGWEDHVRYVERIRNYRGKPIDVQIRRTLTGDVQFISALKPALHDFQTVQLAAPCPPGQKTELAYHVRTLQGYLAKQQRVTVQEGE